MLTLRQSAALLAGAASIRQLEPIAALFGCRDSIPLDTGSRESLGLGAAVERAAIASGVGAIRALLLELREDRPMREVLPPIAARLSQRTPHVLWVIVAVQPGRGDVAIAAWENARRTPRLSALVANRARLTDSDAETLRAMTAAVGARDLLMHGRWVEILGREALGARFYRGLESAVRGIADSTTVGSQAVRDELALLNASRLLFLCFLEAKGWLDSNRTFLASSFEECLARGGRFHERVLRPLFFGTLNTPRVKRRTVALRFGSIPFLNGGLFAPAPVERTARGVLFSDDAYGALLYDLFAQYRFTAAEETSRWNEAAVDPEMLGRAFECLMAHRERRRTGAFFTPFSLVERVTSFALEDAFARGDHAALERLVLLDPACGSGAFLVHALERIATRLADLGDTRDGGTIRRQVLTRSIFGIDLNPTAVWLCQLRLWLSIVIESPDDDVAHLAPLPNLDRNVRVGDALAGDSIETIASSRGDPSARRLRERYARATGARKRSLARELDRVERSRALAAIDARLLSIAARRRDLVAVQRGRDLFGDRYHPSREERDVATELRRRAASLRAARRRIAAGGALPFSFAAHFPDASARGGFDVVIGNPPWVRLHHIAPEQRLAFRRDFFVARHAAWTHGSDASGARSGFASQIDLAALFVERSVRLLAPGGTSALLVPAKLWRSLAGGGVRRFLSENVSLRRIEDHSEAPAAFDAAVYPSLVVTSRTEHHDRCIDVVVHHHGHTPFTWKSASSAVAFDDSPGSPWILLPPDARRAFDLLRNRGRSLAASPLGRPLLGVKCGCNEAFVVTVIDVFDDLAEVETAEGRRVTIERSLLRPLIRGEQLRRWNTPRDNSAIIWTHDRSDAPLASLPPLGGRWLHRWRRALLMRSDARNAARWWSLFRTEGARADRPRVVWADLGREPRASVLESGDDRVPLNTCYVVPCMDRRDAHAFAALLNGPLARAWLDTIAEPARGGYHRYLGWTLALLPLPLDWSRARAILAPLSERAVDGAPPSDSELFAASAAAYGIAENEAAPLVAWMAR